MMGWKKVSPFKHGNSWYLCLISGSIKDVSENSGTPKSSIFRWFSIINHPFWGTTIFGNTQTSDFKPHGFVVSWVHQDACLSLNLAPTFSRKITPLQIWQPDTLENMNLFWQTLGIYMLNFMVVFAISIFIVRILESSHISMGTKL